MTKECKGDRPVLLLGEDRDSGGLEDSDLHQSAVGFHRFAVIKGHYKQLRHRREEANEADTNVPREITAFLCRPGTAMIFSFQRQSGKDMVGILTRPG